MADTSRDPRGGPGVPLPPPGALVAVAGPGGVRYRAGGWAQRLPGRDPVAMAWETRTDAGSVTKILGTTAALMVLADAGEVELDTPVSTYLPTRDQFTIRDLLEHQGGRWEWWPLYLAAGHDEPGRPADRAAAAVDRAARLPGRYPRRSGRHYSDIGFILLGAVVARVAGTDLASAVHDLVLDRFGLADTRYATPAPGAPVAASSAGDDVERTMVRTGAPYPVDGRVEDFAGWREHILVGEVNDGNAYHAFGGVAGHAGLFTTAGDLLRFATGLIRSGRGEGPVSPGTLAEFLRPGDDPGQALGLRIWRTTLGPAYGHTGFPGVAFAALPECDSAVVMVTNRLHAPGAPRPTEQMWLRVLDAAQRELA